MLNPGIKGHQEITVEEKDLAIHVGSGTVHVLATPMMIANMEYTSAASVEELLGEGKTTVGVKVDVSHVAATPKGMKVTQSFWKSAQTAKFSPSMSRRTMSAG